MSSDLEITVGRAGRRHVSAVRACMLDYRTWYARVTLDDGSWEVEDLPSDWWRLSDAERTEVLEKLGDGYGYVDTETRIDWEG